MDEAVYLIQKTSEIENNSNFVSRAFGAGAVATICTVTAITNDISLGGALSTLLVGGTGTTITAPLISYISGPDCKIKLKPFVTGTIGGLALTFGAAVFDHYNPNEAQQQSSTKPLITTQHHSKIS